MLKPGSTVIVWAGRAATPPLRRPAPARLEAKLLEVPDGANSRGLREVGCIPDAGPGPVRGAPGAQCGRDPRRPRRREPRAPRSSSMPTRSATSRAGRRGARRSARRSSSSRFRCSRTPPRSMPTSSFPPSPTPRRREPSPTPTAASSACAPASRTRAACGPCGRCWSSSRALLGDETGIDSGARGARRQSPPRSPSTPASPTRRSADAACAGRTATRPPNSRKPRVPRRPPARRPSRVCRHRCRLNLRRPARGRAARGSDWAPTAICGRRRRRTTAPRCGSWPHGRPWSWRPRMPTASASRRATRSTCAQTGRACGRGSSIRERIQPGAGFLIEGTAEANANALVPGEMVEVTKAGGDA